MTQPHKPTLDVEQMILQEDDPKVRSHLILMLQLVTTVKSLSGTIGDMAKAQQEQALLVETQLKTVQQTVDDHVNTLAQAKGAGWITTKVMPGLMAVVALFSGYVWNQAQNLQGNINQHGVTDSALRAEIANHHNIGAMADLKINNRVDIIEDRLKQFGELLNGKAKK